MQPLLFLLTKLKKCDIIIIENEKGENKMQYNLDNYAEGTYNCEEKGCLYNQDGRCIFNIAPIQQSNARVCNQIYYDYPEE